MCILNYSYECAGNAATFVFVNRNLLPVTQLYVSIDASTKESLKKIDRPLFRDFWPRFLSSLDALSEKVTICYKGTVL